MPRYINIYKDAKNEEYAGDVFMQRWETVDAACQAGDKYVTTLSEAGECKVDADEMAEYEQQLRDEKKYGTYEQQVNQLWRDTRL